MPVCLPRLFPISASLLIPHGQPMVLVESLVRADGETGTISARVESDSMFVRSDATVEPLALLEVIAQACAAYGGWRVQTTGQLSWGGFLVGVRYFEAFGKVLAAKPMEIEVALVKEFGGFYLFQAVLCQAGCEMARASLKAHHKNSTGVGSMT